MSRSKRSLNKRRLFPTPEKRSVQNCVICLDEITKRGKLSVCEHLYCYTCILEWSKTTNKCPICRKRFRCITKMGVSSSGTPPCKVRVFDVEQREHYDNEFLPDDIFEYDDAILHQDISINHYDLSDSFIDESSSMIIYSSSDTDSDVSDNEYGVVYDNHITSIKTRSSEQQTSSRVENEVIQEDSPLVTKRREHNRFLITSSSEDDISSEIQQRMCLRKRRRRRRRISYSRLDNDVAVISSSDEETTSQGRQQWLSSRHRPAINIVTHPKRRRLISSDIESDWDTYNM